MATRSIVQICISTSLLLFGSGFALATMNTPDPAREAEYTRLIGQMTLEEKVSLVGGNKDGGTPGSGGVDNFDTNAIPRLGIPAIKMTDGPVGVRNGAMTAFPSGISLGASFDPALMRETASAIGEEARSIGRNMLLGPCVNVSRQPFGGRNFESFGEDPFLTSAMAREYVGGVQSQNVLTSVKHFAVNDQETERMTINVLVDKRTLFEIHLPAFKAAVDAGAGTVMAAYNRINGQYASENDFLINQVLKGLWGFRGPVVSDWGATHSTVDAANNGLDLEMPISDFFADRLVAAVQNGDVPMSVLDDKVRRLLRSMDAIGLLDPSTAAQLPPAKGPASAEHRDLALKAARESVVLLKNENGFLPLSKSLKSLAVLGPGAQQAWTGGGGSSHVYPAFPVTPLEGLKSRLGSSVQILTPDASADPVEGSVEVAKGADAVVLYLGLNEWSEGEGYDRQFLELPDDQTKLLDAVLTVNPNVVVVLTGGNPFLMSKWLPKTKALVDSWYPGEEGGDAVADVLLGRVNPSGKLPVTFPKRWEDAAAYGNFPGSGGSVSYKEGIFVGYRWFDSRAITPAFPFGFGLSYTNFAFSNLNVRLVSDSNIAPVARVSFDLKNTGAVEGAEVAQLYVGEKTPTLPRPVRELKGFKRVELKPGETQHVEIDLDASSFAYFDAPSMSWKVNPGAFAIEVGSSSRDLPLTMSVVLKAPQMNGRN